jgi:hypothetical protein
MDCILGCHWRRMMPPVRGHCHQANAVGADRKHKHGHYSAGWPRHRLDLSGKLLSTTLGIILW